MQVDQLVVVQPTPFCNIDCSYCYLPDRSNPSRMSEDVLRALYASVFSSTRLREPISFVWHSGEPLALPISYYESALRICQEVNRGFGKTYSHGIQTNAILVTDEWAKFLLANDVSVCVSIDGPQPLHDRFRRDRSGKGTHHKVMQGVRLLQENGVAFSVICVLTYESLSQSDEIYDFFIGNAIYSIAFNIDEIEGPNHSSTFAREDATARYREFHRKLLLKIHAGGNILEVREYSRIFGVIAANRTDEFLEGTNRPFTVISVDWKGNFSTFSPELLGSASVKYGDFILGNVTTDSLALLSG
jgi:uncharacterized protein